MTAISERYAKLAGQMTDRLAAVPADRWDAPTPCEGWTVRDLLDHLLDGPTALFERAGLDPLPPGPDRTEDPAGAFAHLAQGIQAVLEDPARAGASYEGQLGPQTFEGAVSQFICGDLVVHQWDVARATGQDETLDLDELRAVHAGLAPLGDVIRRPEVFGPEVEPPPGADEQTTILSFLGRRV
jgi:uncharacterized protein (TIGR03086 family)